MENRACAATRISVLIGAGLMAWAANAWSASPQELPPVVLRALEQSQLPRDALSVVLVDLESGRTQLEVQATRPVNPASIVKLLTTYAALELLGPSWTWKTPVWLQGTVQSPGPEGVLEGSLHIKGSGDPKLVTERLWSLLQRVRLSGIREIRGDIVLDPSAFEPSSTNAGDFDGEPYKPYNVQARALMLNQRSVMLGFAPDAARGVAQVMADPPLAAWAVDATVPLSRAPCDDWRGALKATLADPQHLRFEGRYPASCGPRNWPIAYADPASYDARLIESLWKGMGGTLGGRVREGAAPATAPSFEWTSPTLSEVVRDINKYSNNTMAQQLFLTLALKAPQGTPATDELDEAPAAGEQVAPAVPAVPNPLAANPQVATEARARKAMLLWLQAEFGHEPALLEGLVIDNGSGLSRRQRLSARLMARLLIKAWRSPVMPDLMASLPASGLDGTLRRSRAAAGRAHLKTGSLRDVAGYAGYVLGKDGRRRVLVAVAHHPQAQAARPALDALLRWAIDTPGGMR